MASSAADALAKGRAAYKVSDFKAAAEHCARAARHSGRGRADAADRPRARGARSAVAGANAIARALRRGRGDAAATRRVRGGVATAPPRRESAEEE